MRKFIIDEQLLTEIGAYLIQRPFAEVAGFINRINTLKVLEEKVEDEKKD